MSVARAAATADEHAHVEDLGLPSGPVAMGETVRAPAAESLLQIYECLPHPDCKRMAVLMLSTTAVERREQHREILRQIAQLRTFESPLAAV
ncbi:hypothetical protein ACIHIX_04985 [Streptomyces sp. NPDC051913]|uniref:hypothetical protein n=1 Tax=Streptomyces sp. NPDC051913 TaxID=3365676 RepID=UPI0037D5F3B0